jgi:hypothetical protein
MSEYTPEFRKPMSPFKAIADWVKRYREAIGLRSELANCGTEEVASLARDIGVSVEELNFAIQKGPHAADELARLLRVLGVDPQKLVRQDPVVVRNLERVCIACSSKGECRHELAVGTAAANYKSFCPNALTLNELFHSESNLKTESSGASFGP